jgi:hypothetical protein
MLLATSPSLNLEEGSSFFVREFLNKLQIRAETSSIKINNNLEQRDMSRTALYGVISQNTELMMPRQD